MCMLTYFKLMTMSLCIHSLLDVHVYKSLHGMHMHFDPVLHQVSANPSTINILLHKKLELDNNMYTVTDGLHAGWHRKKIYINLLG